MSDLHDLYPRLVSASGALKDSLPDGSEHLFEDLLNENRKSVPSQKLHAQLQAIERTLQRVVNKLRAKDEKIINRRAPYQLRYSLKTQEDINICKTLKAAGLVEKFHIAGAPFNQIRSSNIDAKTKTLFLYIHNQEADRLIRQQLGRIGEILGLSPQCSIIREKYLVHVLGLTWNRDDFKKPDLFIRGWSMQNNVNIRTAYWSNKKLLLEFDERGDAESLVAKNSIVYLSGFHGWAEPFDKRMLPKFCFQCAEPGHLRAGCQKPMRCQKCGGFKHQQWGCTNDPHCPNCGGAHPAWAPQCQNEAVLKMLGECAYYREKGVYWAQDVMEQSTAPTMLRNVTRDAEPRFPHTRQKKADKTTNKKDTKKATKKSEAGEDRDEEDDSAVPDPVPTALDKFITRPGGLSSKSSEHAVIMDDEDLVMGEASEPMIMEQPLSRGNSSSSQASQRLSDQPTAITRSPSHSAPPVGNFSLNAWDPRQHGGPRSSRIRTSRVPKDNNDPSQTSIRDHASRSGSTFQSMLRETTPDVVDMTGEPSGSEGEYITESESEHEPSLAGNYEGMYEDEVPDGK